MIKVRRTTNLFFRDFPYYNSYCSLKITADKSQLETTKIVIRIVYNSSVCDTDFFKFFKIFYCRFGFILFIVVSIH